MTLQIELTPAEEARLRERAAARGQAPETLAHEMLRSLLQGPPAGTDDELLPVLDESGVYHPERMEAVLQRIAGRTGPVPHLPREALTREAMYQDHD